MVKNHGKDQLATRAEFEGDLKDPNFNVWYIVGQLLRNGFIQALYPALENSINLNSVEDVKGDTKLGKLYQGTNGPGAGKEDKKTRKEIRKEIKNALPGGEACRRTFPCPESHLYCQQQKGCREKPSVLPQTLPSI